MIELPNNHFVKSWVYVDGAPDIKFNPDGSIKMTFDDGREEIIETELTKEGMKFANIKEDN